MLGSLYTLLDAYNCRKRMTISNDNGYIVILLLFPENWLRNTPYLCKQHNFFCLEKLQAAFSGCQERDERSQRVICLAYNSVRGRKWNSGRWNRPENYWLGANFDILEDDKRWANVCSSNICLDKIKILCKWFFVCLFFTKKCLFVCGTRDSLVFIEKHFVLLPQRQEQTFSLA